MTKIDAMVEKGKDLYSISVNKGDVFLYGCGVNVEEALKDLCDLITDYKKHEGKDNNYWSVVDINTVEWNLIPIKEN